MTQMFPAIWEADQVAGWLWMRLHAHQGGWDEALVLIAPVALLAALVWVATVVAQRRGDASAPPAGSEPSKGRRAAP
jgi:cyanate permease